MWFFFQKRNDNKGNTITATTMNDIQVLAKLIETTINRHQTPECDGMWIVRQNKNKTKQVSVAAATINKCLFLLAIEWWEGDRATKSSRKKENRILRDRWVLSHKKFTVTFSLLNPKHMRKNYVSY